MMMALVFAIFRMPRPFVSMSVILIGLVAVMRAVASVVVSVAISIAISICRPFFTVGMMVMSMFPRFPILLALSFSLLSCEALFEFVKAVHCRWSGVWSEMDQVGKLYDDDKLIGPGLCIYMHRCIVVAPIVIAPDT